MRTPEPQDRRFAVEHPTPPPATREGRHHRADSWIPDSRVSLFILKLGVDEVCIWRKEVIEIHILIGEGFKRSQHSRILPDLDLGLLASMLGRDTLTQAVRDFRKALAAES